MDRRTEDALMDIFDSAVTYGAAEGSKGVATVCREQEETYYVSSICVLRTDERNALCGQFPYKDAGLLQLTRPDSYRPEVLLGSFSLKLPVSVFDSPCLCVPVARAPKGPVPSGVWIVRNNPAEGCYVLNAVAKCEDSLTLAAMPLRFYRFPPFVAEALKAHDVDAGLLRPCLMCTAQGVCPVLVLSTPSRLLYITAAMTDYVESTKGITVCGFPQVYIGDGWNTASKSFKKLTIKRGTNSMKGLTSPLSARIAAAQDTPPFEVVETPEELSQEAAVLMHGASPVPEAAPAAPQQPAVEPQPLPEAPAPEPVPEPASVVPEGAPETAEQPQQDADAAARRKRTVRQPKPVAVDYAALAAQISTPVDSVDDIDKVQEELRSLRDLQIACARRSVNLAAALQKLVRIAVEKYNAIQAILK